MKILQDIKIAADVFCEVRKARKAGAEAVKIKPAFTVPCATFTPAYLNTIEGCQTRKLGREIDQAVKEVFDCLPYETRRQIERDDMGSWADRARFWQRQLKPALPPKEYHAVMTLFIGWYAHCLRMRKEAAE